MLRNLPLAFALLALAACGDITSARAPKHPSQSHPATAPAAQQAQISDEVRRKIEQELRQELDQFSARHAAGRTPLPNPGDFIASLQPGADRQFRVALTGGVGYSVVGACDSSCSDVDIELLQASDGLVVKRDLLRDDYPIIEFTPPANGDYYVRVILKTCARAHCYVAARVLQNAQAS